jgi:hypothetical protein
MISFGDLNFSFLSPSVLNVSLNSTGFTILENQDFYGGTPLFYVRGSHDGSKAVWTSYLELTKTSVNSAARNIVGFSHDNDLEIQHKVWLK